MLFGKKLVSDALLNAVKEVTSGEQVDSSGKSLSVGDKIKVQEGPHSGMSGTISGFKNTGTSEVQLDRGPHVSMYNDVLLNEGTWAVPTTKSKWAKLQKLMKTKLPVGDEQSSDDPPKVEKQKASSKLYNLIGDDELFDDLYDLSKKKGPKADARPVVLKWLKRNEFDLKKKDGYKGQGWSRPGTGYGPGGPRKEEVETNGNDVENGETSDKKKKKASKKNGNCEKVEINPEVQEAQNTSRIINFIKDSIKHQRGLIENEDGPKDVGSTEATQNYKDMTPGQTDSGLPPEALDYEKYVVDTAVPGEELEALLNKGPQLK